MRRTTTFLLGLPLLSSAAAVEAQSLISASRPGATAAQINSAIAVCPAGQVVRLNAGTYFANFLTAAIVQGWPDSGTRRP